jgi:hypothetical protein
MPPPPPQHYLLCSEHVSTLQHYLLLFRAPILSAISLSVVQGTYPLCSITFCRSGHLSSLQHYLLCSITFCRSGHLSSLQHYLLSFRAPILSAALPSVVQGTYPLCRITFCRSGYIFSLQHYFMLFRVPIFSAALLSVVQGTNPLCNITLRCSEHLSPHEHYLLCSGHLSSLQLYFLLFRVPILFATLPSVLKHTYPLCNITFCCSGHLSLLQH